MTKATARAKAPAENNEIDRLRRMVYALRRQVAGLGDDAAWRAFLEVHAKVGSLQGATEKTLRLVRDALHNAGAPRRAGSRGREAQDFLAGRLWQDLYNLGIVRDPGEKALLTFARRQTGAAADALPWLNGEQRNRLVDALKRWLVREGVEYPTPYERRGVALRRQGAGLPCPPGLPEKLCILRAQAARLQKHHPDAWPHSDLSAWLAVKFSISDPDLLDLAVLENAIGRLGTLLRRAAAKAGEGA